MIQERIDAFMAEIKAVSEKHGIFIGNPYNERIDLDDQNGERLAEYINIESFRAERYVEPEPIEHTGSAIISMSEAKRTFHEYYAQSIAKALNEPSPLLKSLFKGDD